MAPGLCVPTATVHVVAGRTGHFWRLLVAATSSHLFDVPHHRHHIAFRLQLETNAKIGQVETGTKVGHRAPTDVRFEWWTYPGLTSYKVYRSTDPSQSAAFVDVTVEDGDPTDTLFDDASVAPISYFIVTGVGPNGEGPKGHFGE